MRSSHRLLSLAVLLGAGLACYALWPRDEALVERRLTALARAASAVTSPAALAALQTEIGSAFASNAVLRSADLDEPLTSRAIIGEHAALLLQSPAPLSFALSNLEVRVEGRAAHVEGDLAITRRGQSGLPREIRHASALLSRVGSEFVIDSLEVERELHEQPEARP